MSAKKYPVFLVKTSGSDDYMAHGKLHIAAKSRRSVGKHFDIRYYGAVESVERVAGLSSSRLGYLNSVL